MPIYIKPRPLGQSYGMAGSRSMGSTGSAGGPPMDPRAEVVAGLGIGQEPEAAPEPSIDADEMMLQAAIAKRDAITQQLAQLQDPGDLQPPPGLNRAQRAGWERGTFGGGGGGDEVGSGLRPLTPAMAKDMSGLLEVVKQMDGLHEDWEQNGKYDIGGWGAFTRAKGSAAGQLLGGRGATDIATLKGEINRLIGQGRKIIDTGMLSNQDQERLAQAFPKVDDSPEIKRVKVQMMRDLARKAARNAAEAAGTLGLDVPSTYVDAIGDGLGLGQGGLVKR